MKRLRFYLRIYRKIVVQSFKSKMSYRSDFIISMIGMILTDISELLAFYIIFLNFPSVCGWTYYEMLFLYGFSLVSLTPLQCLFDNNWHLRHYVYDGDFIKYCFRPIDIFFYYISEEFDTKGIGQFLVGMGTIIFAWYKLKLPVTFFNVLAVVVALFTASLFMIGIMNFAAATCFFLTNSGMVMVTMNKFRDYAKYPVTVFSSFFRIIFTFIIPIAYIAYYPSLVVLRPDNIPILTWIAPAYGILFFFLSYKFWMLGANKYSGTGS